MCSIKCSSQNAAVVLQMLHMDCFCFLNKDISPLQTFYPQVCPSNITHASAFCHKLCPDLKKKIRLGATFKIADHDQRKMRLSAPIPIMQIRWGLP